MTKYQWFLVGAFVFGLLLAIIPGYNFMTWEFWVLSAPYWILGGFTT